MNQVNSYFINSGGRMPSNNRANVGPSPQQRFVLALRDLQELSPTERIVLNRAAGELYCAEHKPSDLHAYFRSCLSDHAILLDPETVDGVVRLYQRVLGDGAVEPVAKPDLMEMVGPFDGPPALIVQAVVAHVLESADDEGLAAVDDRLGMAEAALRAVQGVKPALNEYAALDMAHAESLAKYQVEWAVKGFMAGMRSARTGRPVVEPDFAYVQDLHSRIHVSNFTTMAPLDGKKIYTQQIAGLHREQMALTCLAGFWRFAEIGAYMAQAFGGAA